MKMADQRRAERRRFEKAVKETYGIKIRQKDGNYGAFDSHWWGWQAKANDAYGQLEAAELNYDGAMYEIEAIVHVARDNPDSLKDFLQCNFPKEWGLTKRQHRAILNNSIKKTKPPKR